MLPNRFDEALAVTRQLCLADAANTCKIIERGGASLRHVAQSRIVEDHVRGEPVFVGELFAQRAQDVEQWLVHVLERCGRRRQALPPRRRTRACRPRDLHGSLTFEHLPALGIETQDRVAVLGFSDQPLMQQRSHQRAPFFQGMVPANPMNAQLVVVA
jgi:hypothetical protein